MTDLAGLAPAASAQGERVPLSCTQEFLCAFDEGDGMGPFGPRYHNTRGWRLRGPVDLPALRGALDDLVARHEALRTLIVRGGADPHQLILPAVPAELRVHGLSVPAGGSADRSVEEFLNEVEAGTIAADRPPLLRAELGQLDGQDGVLVLVAHHVATDGWSMRLLMRDLAACYAARTEGGRPALPPPAQYREFSTWQRETLTGGVLDAARGYWREKLAGARMLGIGMDRPRSASARKVTSTHRFTLDATLASALLERARELRSSPFIVLLAVYNVLLSKITGATDIVVPTITAGRGDPRFDDTVGACFNFIPLRTDITGCTTFGEVAARTRATCLEAQKYEVPFAYIAQEVPDIMSTFAAPGLAVGAIQVFQHPFAAGGRAGRELAYDEIRRRLLSQPVSADIPDGLLWTLDIDRHDGAFGNIKFNSSEFDEATISALAGEFRRLVRSVSSDKNSGLLSLAASGRPATRKKAGR